VNADWFDPNRSGTNNFSLNCPPVSTICARSNEIRMYACYHGAWCTTITEEEQARAHRGRLSGSGDISVLAVAEECSERKTESG